MNKVITTQGNVQFQFPDGKIVNVHPNHIYTVFNEDTVSFILVALPKTSGLSTMTSKAEDLELNGTVYSFAELPNAVSEAFAIAGAQARCEIVDELPETGYTNTIYLVPQPAPQTGFDEYVYILDQGWELIGDTSIEMDNYVLKTVFSGYTADTAVVLNGLRTDVDTTSGNVITETERALLAESGLSDAIDAETTAREAADGVISGAVDTVSSGLTQEVQRAQNAESGLSDAIDVVSGALDTHIQDEVRHISGAERTSWNEKTKTISLTQAEYDVLPSSAKTDATKLYVISDALPIDLSVYAKVSALTEEISARTDADTALDNKINAVSAATDAALANKQNTLIAGENITISSTTSGDVISSEGGGKAIEAGRGIDIASGETADTISFNLPIYSGTGQYSIIIGDGRNISSGKVSVAEGFQTSAMTSYAHSEGSRTLASGSYSSHAEGSQTSATSEASHSEGYQTTASGQYSHSEGWGTLASGRQSHSEGKQTSATTTGAHSEGSGTLASGEGSHSEGKQTSATTTGAHSEGKETIASGAYSHAEGWGTTASGAYSHTEGNKTIASGNSSHSEGYQTTASGAYSHAEGSGTTASGAYSHAEGWGTKAQNNSEHASGYFNVSSSGSSTFGDSGNTLFSVGNGTADDARHNAFEIRQNGDIYLTKDGQDVKLQDALGGGSITVDSALDSGSTNPVENQALYSELRLSDGGEAETTLTFEGDYTTNYPNGCTKIKVKVVGSDNGSNIGFYNDFGNLGSIMINNWGSITVTNNFDGATYEISGTTIIISYPNVTNVTRIQVNAYSSNYTYKAVTTGAPTALKDQVVANTAAIEAKVDTTTFNSYASSVDSALGGKLNISDYVVDSALNVASRNPVQNQTLYSELRLSDGGEAETTLTFEGNYTTNYPNGCTKIKVEVVPFPSNSTNTIIFNDEGGYIYGYINVTFQQGNITVDTSNFQGATYEISGYTVIISYPTVTTVTKLNVNPNQRYTYKAITSSTTPLKDQVVENTTALGGMKIVKLTESEYQSLSVKDQDTLYVVIPDPTNP